MEKSTKLKLKKFILNIGIASGLTVAAFVIVQAIRCYYGL